MIYEDYIIYAVVSGSILGLLLARDTKQEMCRMGQNIRFCCVRDMWMVPNNYIKKSQRNTTKNDRKTRQTTVTRK